MEILSSIKFVFLWTDLLIIVLLLSISVFIFLMRRDPKLSLAWRKISCKSTNVIAITLLLFYFSIAIFDSIHFRYALHNDGANKNYSAEIASVLDVMLKKIANNIEKTYSAPFSAYAYNPELIQNASGHYEWVDVRLKYGGAHLTNPNVEKIPDITKKILQGVLYGLAICVILFILSLAVLFTVNRHRCGYISRYILRKHKSDNIAVYNNAAKNTYDDVNDMYNDTDKNNSHTFAWKSLLITCAFLIIIIAVFYVLMPYYHILGTDKVGKDVFYAALKSIRTGVVIGILTTIIMLPFAIFFGTIAGYFRGFIDDAIQYIYTTISSVPGVLLIAASVLILQVFLDKHAASYSLMLQRTDLRLLILCFVLGVTGWVGLCRLLRAETLKLRGENYIIAARALGLSSFKIIYRHIIPNLSHIILIAAALDFSGLVLAEAVLSYVGVGVDPATYSFGNMINAARMEMAREPIVWWPLLGAFVFMFILVFVANVFSDAVRDALDPRITV